MLIGKRPIGTIAIMGGLPAVLTDFAYAFAQLVLYSQESLCNESQFIHLERVKFSDHGPARNHLAASFLGDWLLMLDTDHEPEPDLLVRMLDRLNGGLDVLTAVYRYKEPPHSPVVFVRCPDDELRPIASYPQGLFRVQAAGAGCLLVRRKVFERIKLELKSDPFDRLASVSEDHSFFRRLEKLDIPVWCDGRIECPHLRVNAITKLVDVDYNESEPFQVEFR